MEGLKKNVQAEQLVILNANPPQFYVGSSSTEWMVPNFETNDNDMPFAANMLDAGYTVPDMIVPSPGHNLNPTQRYTVNPFEEYAVTPAQGLAEGYTVTPAQGYSAVNLAEGYTVTPAQGYSAVNPAEEYHVNPVEGYNNNSGEGENANPGGSAGGNNGNPQEKVFDPLDFLLEDLEAGFSG
ncbi:hypothetical protein V6N13_069433 [Hibiscus sabdariffa]|uniref:Uncharacterized protein n=1 Tax=Hibiscus sabdariffa TaxID=183260 RepID=A0ABR2PGB5_9ROSI